MYHFPRPSMHDYPNRISYAAARSEPMPRRSAATPYGLGAAHIADPDLYARGDPESVFRGLRAESPVSWIPHGDSGFWAITRHADAVNVYRDPQTFSSQRGMMLASLSSGDPAAGKMLVVTDPPRHSGLRRIIGNALSPRIVRQLEHAVARVAQARVDEAVERGTCDFVEVVAAPLPVAVVCQLMGIPERDWELMHRHTSRAFGFDDPAYGDPELAGAVGGHPAFPEPAGTDPAFPDPAFPDPAGTDPAFPDPAFPEPAGTDPAVRRRSALATRLRAHAEIMVYYADLLDQRRAAPREDLVSILLAGKVDGRPLTEEEVLLNCDNVVLGGNETTRHAAAGGVFTLASRPDQWTRLRADRTLIAPAVEEILRWTTPAIHVLRVATRDTVLGGRTIRAGEAVAVWNTSANRDEDVLAAADMFDVTRFPNRHLTFGFGEHFCLGAAVARLELRILLEAMLTRIARLELAGTAQPLRSNFIRGYRRLPLRVHP